MIEYDKDFDSMSLHCDGCSYQEIIEGTWRECIDEAKVNGWKLYSDEWGKWHHYCGDCFRRLKSQV